MAPATSPANWAQIAGAGSVPGVPAMPSTLDAMPTSAPPAPQFVAPPQTFPSAGTGDWHDHFAPAPAPAPQAPPAAYAPPPEVLPAPPPSAAPAPAPAPAGALPAYGADLRPASTAMPAAPAGPSAPALPTGPSAGSTPVTHTAAAPLRPVTQVSPPGAGFAGPAAAATAGAVAGAASADATATARLQRIVDSVARQQPRLGWAAGERADRTTVLATDLAAGWIPPDIELPAAVTLLAPEKRRGDLQSLLGEVIAVAAYTPGRYLPGADEPVATSPRPRRAPDVGELGWELNRATCWRDGLPRLAHTLARAASAGTGVLDSEAALLRDELDRVRDDVLGAYPDRIDAAAVGNWQLLAAIAALVDGDPTVANYHFAWFQTGGQ